jgi:hypothetical protein
MKGEQGTSQPSHVTRKNTLHNLIWNKKKVKAVYKLKDPRGSVKIHHSDVTGDTCIQENLGLALYRDSIFLEDPFNSLSCDLCLCCCMPQRFMSMVQPKCILCLLHIFILVVHDS